MGHSKLTDRAENDLLRPQPAIAARSADTRVSVIIPTKYRPTVVECTARSVFRQLIPPFQVIIIDQSCSDETRQRIQNQYAMASVLLKQAMQLSYVHDPMIAGAAAARNRGTDMAEGDIWLFLDDDVLLEPDFIEQLLGVYRTHPNVTGVSGVFTNYSPPSWLRRAWTTIFLRGPFHDERQPIYWKANRLRSSDPLPVRKFTGALMSFRAEEIRGLRFDENVRKTGAEDVDFCSHLRPGSVLLVAPTARLYHERALGGRSGNHWVQTEMELASYLYRRNWSIGLRNRLCFAWLLTGYSVAALLSVLRRRSLAPWRGLIAGMREGAAQAAHVRSTEGRAQQAGRATGQCPK